MGASTRNGPETARFISAKGALFLAAAVAAFTIASEGSAEEGPDEVHVQGGWAYTATVKGAAVEDVAATRAAEDAGCGGGRRRDPTCNQTTCQLHSLKRKASKIIRSLSRRY
jgi:hypothetical protein